MKHKNFNKAGFTIGTIFQDIKNNRTFWTIISILLFSFIIYFITQKQNEKNNAIDKHLKKTVAYTIECSHKHSINYIFFYRGKKYVGSTKYYKSNINDICRGVRFVIEFDSVQPMNNRILLDSMITSNPLEDHRFDNVYLWQPSADR